MSSPAMARSLNPSELLGVRGLTRKAREASDGASAHSSDMLRDRFVTGSYWSNDEH